MKPISIEVIFPSSKADQCGNLLSSVMAARTPDAMLEAIADANATTGLVGAWIQLVKARALIAGEAFDEAVGACADALRTLLAEPDKKHTDFLALVAGTLFDLAYCHFKIGDSKHAEKELIKAQKILDKLTKKDNARFAASLVAAIEASTEIFHSKLKLMNLLAHYQVATELYQDKLASGVDSAVASLVDSLKKQGDIHLQLCNFRDAVKYYTKALRYSKKINSSMGMSELRISLNLAKALLNIINRHAAGRQLLDSLLPLAVKLNAKAEIAEIRNLQNEAMKAIDVMAIIKNLFKNN